MPTRTGYHISNMLFARLAGASLCATSNFALYMKVIVNVTHML